MWSIFPCAFIFVHLVSRIYLLKLDSWKLTFLLNSFSMICCYLLFSRKVVSDSVTPWTAARQASLSFTVSWSLVRLMSLESVMPSNHLIFCRPLSFCPQSFPASGFFPKSWLFKSGGQSIGASASPSVLPANILGWFPYTSPIGLGRGSCSSCCDQQSTAPQERTPVLSSLIAAVHNCTHRSF